MSIDDLTLVHYPHPALMAKTLAIEAGDYPDLEERIRRMFEIMYENKGVGLAAPQVGWSVRLCVVNSTLESSAERVFVNPKILDREGQENGEEGCLSFPNIYVKVQRALKIEVEYQNERLEPKREFFDGFEARVVQHEIDHLENILLVHRMSQAERFLNRKKLKELKSTALKE